MKRRLVFIVLITLFAWFVLWLTPKSQDYSEVKRRIGAGEIVSAVLTEDDVTIVDVAGTKRRSRIPPHDASLIQALEAAHVPYRVEHNWSGSCAGQIPVILVLVAIYMITLGRGSVPSFGGLKSTGPKVTFADVAGYEETKRELEDVVAYLRDPKAYGRLGARPPKGVLLVGPPGTGKTFLARALAGESGAKFVNTTGSSFQSMFVSVSSGAIRTLFKDARANAPCIIFIDEIDSVGRKRRDHTGSGAEQEFDNTLNTMLTEMDGFRPTEGIVVIAATNRRDVLDEALLRPGRFDRHVQVGLPDQLTRRRIAEQHAKGISVGADVDYAHVAVLTAGLAGAHIANVVNDAAVIATRRSAKTVEMRDFREAVDRAHAGVENGQTRLCDDDRRRVAVHESGHAVATAAAGIGGQVQKVTILGRGQALGYNLLIPEEGGDLLHTRTELLQKICSLLGGRAAEEIVLGEPSSGASNDLESVERLVTLYVARLGLGTSLPNRVLDPNGTYPDDLHRRLDAERTALVAHCYAHVCDGIRNSQQTLLLMTEALLRRDTIENEEVQRLLAAVPVKAPTLPPSS